jgi:hypothetical protein
MAPSFPRTFFVGSYKQKDNDDMLPYIMMLSIDMVMERRAWLALVK